MMDRRKVITLTAIVGILMLVLIVQRKMAVPVTLDKAVTAPGVALNAIPSDMSIIVPMNPYATQDATGIVLPAAGVHKLLPGSASAMPVTNVLPPSEGGVPVVNPVPTDAEIMKSIQEMNEKKRVSEAMNAKRNDVARKVSDYARRSQDPNAKADELSPEEMVRKAAPADVMQKLKDHDWVAH